MSPGAPIAIQKYVQHGLRHVVLNKVLDAGSL